jgi:Flp pilus assembly protein TadD
MEKMRGTSTEAHANFRQVIDLIEEFERSDSENNNVLSFKAMALASVGDVKKAETILAKLAAESAHDGDILHNIARCYAILGNSAKAGEFKSRAVAEHAGPSEKELQIDPHFSKLFSN